jgi:hypothetical protein
VITRTHDGRRAAHLTLMGDHHSGHTQPDDGFRRRLTTAVTRYAVRPPVISALGG